MTGMGAVSAIGHDVEAFWSALLAGRTGAGPVRSFDTTGLRSGVGCEVPDYRLPDRLRAGALGGRCSELALLAAAQAIEAGGAEALLRDSDAAAVVVGTTMGDATRFETERAGHTDRPADDRELAALAHRPLDIMARSVAGVFRVRGPVTTVPTACAAGAYAVGLAAAFVATGRVERALAVGCEAFSRLAFLGFSRLGAMSPDVCRPFSGDRGGLLLGEGAAAVLIETEAGARARGAEVLGFVDGFGLSCDAHHITGPHPEGRGAARAMRAALEDAGISAEEVDYVNAHGTGTALNDRVESRAIREVFGARGGRIPVSSIKALTGHTMGAAGCLEVVASILTLRHQVIPPTWNWLRPDPECDIDCVPNQPRSAALRRVMSNSYAFGGNNASLVLASPGVTPAVRPC